MQLAVDLGIVLSLVLGCLLLALIAELYYMLCWSPRVAAAVAEVDDGGASTGGFGKELLGLIRWKKKKKKKKKKKQQQQQTAREQRNMMGLGSAGAGDGGVTADIEIGGDDDSMIRGFGEESVEAELKRLHNLAGPPRFLFTITEETKDDLESEGHRSDRGSRTRSLSDLMVSLDNSMFNPLFESAVELDLDLSRLRSSPPPKFKFLRDAEEKLLRGLVEAARRRTVENGEGSDDDGSSVVTVIVGKNVEKCQSGSSQALPLSSSPSTPFIPPN